MPEPRLPSSPLNREFEEIEYVRPDGTVDILEFEKGTPDHVIQQAIDKYTEEVSGQRVVPPVSEFGRVTAAQGALTGLDRAKSGVTPAPAPTLGGFFEKPDEYLGHLAKSLTWDQITEAIADPAAYAQKLGDIISAPSRGLQMAASGYEDLAAGDRAPAARALEAGFARAGGFVPAAAGVLADLHPSFDPAAQQFYEASQRAADVASTVPLEGPRSVFDIKTPEDMTSWVVNVFGEQAPIILGLVGTGTIAGPGAVAPTAMAMETGIIAQQQMADEGQVDPYTAVTGGVVAGALEAAPIMSWLRRTSMGDDAVRWVGNRMKSIGTQMGQEMPTEYAQEIVEALATEFAAANRAKFTASDWEEGMRVIKQTQPEAIGAAAAAGVIAPIMGAFGGGDMVADPRVLSQEVVRQKFLELQRQQAIAREMAAPQIPARGIQDIIRSTLEQRQVPPLGSSPEVTGGPTVPPIEEMPPTEPAEVEPSGEALPRRPPGPRWTADPGAMPGEPEAFLDDGKAAIVEVEIDGKPNRFAATTNQGEIIGEFDTFEEAAQAAEKAFPLEEEEEAAPEFEPGPTGLEAAHRFQDTGEVVRTGAIHQAPVDEDVELGFYDHNTGEFLTREEALGRVQLKEPVSDTAKAGTGLDAVDLSHGDAVLKTKSEEKPTDRRKPGRPTIPPGIRGDEAARLKQLMRSGRMDEAEAFAEEIQRRGETDTLTGLRNQGAHQRAVDEAPTGSRHLYLDLDDFKELNDSLGHAAGDEALRQVGEIISEALDRADGFEGFRRGGDEFAVLGTNQVGVLEDLAEFIRNEIENIEIEVENEDGSTATGYIGASYGIGNTLEEADAALYRDKEGKGARREAAAEARGVEPEPTTGRDDAGVAEPDEEAEPEREDEGAREAEAEEEVEAPSREQLEVYAVRSMFSLVQNQTEKIEEWAKTPRTNAEIAEYAAKGYGTGITGYGGTNIVRAGGPEGYFADHRGSGKSVSISVRGPDDVEFTIKGKKLVDAIRRAFNIAVPGEAEKAAPARERGFVAGPNATYRPTEEATNTLTRLWADAIVGREDEILRDEDEREEFVEEVYQILFDDAVKRNTKEGQLESDIGTTVGDLLQQLGERKIIQIARDAYEGKEARANKPLPFLERVKETAKKKVTGAEIAKRMSQAETLEDLDAIRDEAREADVWTQKQVELAYERREDKLLYDLEPNLQARMNLKRLRHDRPPMKAHPDSRAVEEAKTPEGMRRQLEENGSTTTALGRTFSIHEGPNGWFYREAEGNVTTEKGGAGPNAWSKDTAIEKILTTVFGHYKKAEAAEEPELSPAGADLLKITDELDRWDGALDRVIAQVEKRPSDLVAFDQLLKAINDWWDRVEEGTAKEGAQGRYGDLTKRLQKARAQAKLPDSIKGKKKAKEPPYKRDYEIEDTPFYNAYDKNLQDMVDAARYFYGGDTIPEDAVIEKRYKGRKIDLELAREIRDSSAAAHAVITRREEREARKKATEGVTLPPAVANFEKQIADAIGNRQKLEEIRSKINNWFSLLERKEKPPKAVRAAYLELLEKVVDAIEETVGAPTEAAETAPEAEAVETPEISEPAEEAPAEPAPAPSGREAQDIELMKRLQDELGATGEPLRPLTSERIFEIADEVYGGTRAEVAYQESDVYDVLEAAFNNAGARFAGIESAADLSKVVRRLDEKTKKLPKQPARSEKRSDLQQFSTPPSYAAVVAWLANISENDIVLEPSAGTGNIIAQAFAYNPARVIGNEIDAGRRTLLGAIRDVDAVYPYDADHLQAFMSKAGENPTVVVMNPPFSRDVKKKGKRQIHVGMRHVLQAVKLLPENGRVVAIVGGGLGNAGPNGGAHHESPGYRADFKKIKEAGGDLKANVRVPGSVYATHGTNFHTRILIIDKLPEGQQVLIGKSPVSKEVANLEELTDILREVRNERRHPTQVPESPAGEGVGAGVEEVGAAEAEEPTVDVDVAATPPGRVGGTDAGTEGSPTGVSPATGGEESAGGVQRPATVDETAVGDTDVVEGTEPGEPGGAGERAGRGTARRPDSTGQRVQDRGDESLRVDRLDKIGDPKEQDQGDIFSPFTPTLTVRGSKPHPTPLSESLIMGSIDLPEVEYALAIPKKVIESGAISEAQLEPIVYAGAAHSEMLPDGETRKGFFVGDGTGVGKTRVIGGVILDNWHQGRKKAVVLSPDSKLWDDFREELGSMGFPTSAMFKVPKLGEEIKRKEGILYLTYATLVSNRQGKGDENDVSRLDQVLEWLGEDFDGVIAFDEAHLMGNSMAERMNIGTRPPSKRGMAGWKLQNAVPDARVLYASATGATEIRNLAFGARLGLWGPGTPFASREDFVNEMVKGGLSAMEIVAQDMKRLGLYIARNLVLDVEYERLTHELTAEQRQMYDTVAEAWRIIFNNVEKALLATGQVTEDEYGNQRTSQAARSAKSRFYGDQQRFFNTFLASLKAPTIIKAMERDLEAGHSPVIQVKHTGEAALDRALAQNLSQDEIQDIEIDSMGIVMHYLESAFPVKKYEEYEDEEGNTQTREVLDPDTGQAVLDPEAVALRDALLDKLGGMKMPELPLDQIVNHFGPKNVAEVTGRSKRRVYDEVKKRWHIEKRSARHATADRNAFMAGKKKILVFSMDAGGTGHSYHASLEAKNQALRRHYVLEAGWRADQAIQALGRTHRSGQAQPPVWILTETNLAGEKRFVSTVARRLQQLGALTKGSREASGQELYSEMDNLETDWAQPALNAYFRSLRDPNAPIGLDEFMDITGLNLLTPEGGLRAEGSMPDVPKFMNRVLALPLEQQNIVFDGFMSEYEMAVADAKASGTYDVGTETILHDGARVEDEQLVYDEGAAQSRYVHIIFKKRNNAIPFDEVPNVTSLVGGPRFFRNAKSKKVWAAVASRQATERRTGNVFAQYRVMGPDRKSHLRPQNAFLGKNWEELTGKEAEAAWNAQAREVPEFDEQDLHLVTGALLPIWDRFPDTLRTEIRRIRTDDGRVHLGRMIREGALRPTLKKLGAGQKKVDLTAQQIFDQVLKDNYEVELANGWKFARRMVHGEERVEIIGPDYAWNDPLRKMGVLLERPSGYKNRFFVPTDPAQGPKIIDKVIAGQTITDVSNPRERGVDDDGDLTDNTTDFYAMIDPLGGLISRLAEPFTARRAPRLDPIFVPPELRHQIPGIEERKAAARRGAIEETTREKALKAANDLKRSFRSSFEYLNPDESATMAVTTDILRQYRAAPQFGRAVAYDMIRNITEGLDTERMILFTDYLALGDIIKDVEDGLYEGRSELPFGYSHRSLGEAYDPERDIEADYARIRGLVENNPDVLAAVQRRQTLQRQLTRKLVNLGILRPEVLSDPRYYHRQVLEHLNAKTQFPLGATAGVDVHMRKKSFQRKRAGGSDFNLAYHEAEFEYLAQAMAQIAKVETLERLKEIHDIVPELKQQAKQRNNLLAEQKWAEDLGLSWSEALEHWELEPMQHPTWYYRSRIAIATQRLGKLAAERSLFVPGWEHLTEELADAYLAWSEEESEGEGGGTFIFDHPQWFHFLSELAAQPDADIEENPGPIMALSIFKNIREREQFIKGTLGRRYATWRTLAKDIPGVTTWQPQEGHHFFFGHTISDKVLDQVLAGEKLLQEEDVRDMLIVGGPRETWVIPEGLAATLDNWGPRDEGQVEDVARWLLSSWKQWVLLNPLRAVKYNFNNMSGDLDIVLAYDPRILKGFAKAADDLWKYQVQGRAGRTVSKEIQDAMKLGVVDSGLTIYEIPDIKRTGAFRALVDTNNPNAFQKAAEGYWHGIKNLTTWRENILRLAAYRYFQERVAAGDKVYAASNRMQIDAIEDVNERAAKLARELVGDYGNISAAGQWLRSHLLPFYSWLEINAPRYVRLMKNLPHEGRGGGRARGGLVGAGAVAKKAALFALKVNILYGAVALWNRLMFPDEDKKINKNRRQLHLILGHRADGTIRSVRFEGALADALEWFGLEDYPQDIADWVKGKKDALDIISEAGKAPINRLIQSWEPFSKTTFELVLGRGSFPSFFEEGKSWKLRTRPIRNRMEHLARTVSMDWLVRKVSRLTSKPIPKRPKSEAPGPLGNLTDLMDAVLFYRTDPGEAAYWHARDLVVKWQKKFGDEMPSITPTERGNALYYHRKALMWGDQEAADAWLKKYVELGGKAEGYAQSIARQHPLGSMSKAKKEAFVKSLTPEEVEEIKEGVRWYEKVYGGSTK